MKCFPFNAYTSLMIPSFSSFSTKWPGIKRSIERHGFVRLHMNDSSESTLKRVASLFGPSQKHVRNPDNGITEIVGISSKQSGQVVSQIEFFPHTDGHYLNGVIRKNNGFLRVTPPHLVLLQCVQPAQVGGMSCLVDGQKILEEILLKERKLLHPLFSRDQTAVLRGDHLLMDSPIFRQQAKRRYAIRFSYDRDFLCTTKARAAFAAFNQRYILNPNYSARFPFVKNEICVIDNQRLLHGRTAFTGERFLRRLWLFDEKQSIPMVSPQGHVYYETDVANEDSLAKFATYGPHLEKRCSVMKPAVQTGIKLNPTLDKRLHHLLQVY